MPPCQSELHGPTAAGDLRSNGFDLKQMGLSNYGQRRISQCTIQVSSRLAAKKSCGYALVWVDRHIAHIELCDRVPLGRLWGGPDAYVSLNPDYRSDANITGDNLAGLALRKS
jgi:hypothetical protein